MNRLEVNRRVLDIAGDGENNTGPHLQVSREKLGPALQVKALATTHEAARFYETYVIRGVGAFVERTDGYERFTEAMPYPSTKPLRRVRASSHWRPTSSSQALASAIGSGLSAKRVSRPARTLDTSPADSSTRRCLLTAWRVRVDPLESWVSESG
jgi:Protein of unknown function (DUF1194)